MSNKGTIVKRVIFDSLNELLSELDEIMDVRKDMARDGARMHDEEMVNYYVRELACLSNVRQIFLQYVNDKHIDMDLSSTVTHVSFDY